MLREKFILSLLWSSILLGENMLILVSKVTIIGIILTIAVVSASAAFAIYLASTADKRPSDSASEERIEDAEKR